MSAITGLLQRAESRQRKRFLRRDSYASWNARPGSERALETLLEELPGREGAEDRRAWWHLVLAHAATCDWARAAQAEKERAIGTLSAQALADVAVEEVRGLEASRLHFLMGGAISQICLGMVSHDQAASTIRAHVRGVLAGHDEAA